MQFPLSMAWRQWIADKTHPASEPFDAIVIGSGYGGSVAALRLVEKHYRVLLLERGAEYLPGEFPNDLAFLPKHLRVIIPGQGTPVGRASGLFEFRLGQGVASLVANGLGGGSLINAGVTLEPTPEVFSQEVWPAAIRHQTPTRPEVISLDQAFELAKTTLGVHPYSTPQGIDPKTVALHKLQPALASAGRPIHVIKDLPLTLNPTVCTGCGDCFSGCNVPGAKLTVRDTYLRQAFATGRLQILTHAQAYRIRRSRAATGELSGGWEVVVFATDAQHEVVQLAEAACLDPSGSSHTARVLKSPLVVLAAGSFGSTELLQRSQSLEGSALAFSPALGTRFSTNGDSLSALANMDTPVHAVGHGALKPPADGPDRVGPTITSTLDLRKHRPLEEQIILQDGAMPGMLAPLLGELIVTAATLDGLEYLRWFTPAGRSKDDPLGASLSYSSNTQILLMMGHDQSAGRLVWMQGQDCTAPYWAQPELLTTYRTQEAMLEAMRSLGLPLHPPTWRLLPASASQTMEGPAPPRTLLTVHPLGGCVMSDDPLNGVVNDLGQVWVHDPGYPGRTLPSSDLSSARPQLYDGLYVLDGSIVPSSLGCNPLLTITALAERAMSGLPEKPKAPPAANMALKPPLTNPPRDPRAFCRDEFPIAVELRETLRCANPKGAAQLVSSNPQASFEATFGSDDQLATMRESQHKFLVKDARLDLTDSRGVPLASYTSRPGGWFLVLPSNASSSGRLALVRTVALPLCAVVVAALSAVTMILILLGCYWVGLDLALRVVGYSALSLVGAVLVFAASAFGRTALTWALMRLLRDLPFARKKTTWSQIVGLIKQWIHATECRTMEYSVGLVRDPKVMHPDTRHWPKHLWMSASKTVMYRAGCWQLLKSVLLRTLGRQSPHQALRPTMWEQIMNPQVQLYASSQAPGWLQRLQPAWLKGEFVMGFENLMNANAFQINKMGDSTRGMFALLAYPLLFLRFAIKTRLFDLRLPSYSNEPVVDRCDDEGLNLRLGKGKTLMPETTYLTVPRGRSNLDTGNEATDALRLALHRYRRPAAAGASRGLPEVQVNASWREQPVCRAKSILLLHAFGQSGLTYSFKQTEQNLAEAFYAAGYEVWIFESRMSTRGAYATQPHTVDMLGEFDVPKAVHHIVSQLASELGATHPVQISAFGQCIGAASLWMALLKGRLVHPSSSSEAAAIPMIAQAMFSQVHAWIKGTPVSESKTWLPGVLQAVAPNATIPFAVRGAQPSLMEAWLDRLLASMPVPHDEYCNTTSAGSLDLQQRRKREDAEATCRRIRFIEAPLYKHRNLNQATHDAMPRLFGPANVLLFAHARRFLEREQLVDENGANVYLTDEAISRYLDFPIQLMHGQENELFDVVSIHRTHQKLSGVHPQWFGRFAAQPIIVPGYGHLDVLIGATAHRDVYPQLIAFFDQAQHCAQHNGGSPAAPLSAPCPPEVGPLVGWARVEDGKHLKLRLSLAPGAACNQLLLWARTGTGWVKLAFDKLPNPESQTYSSIGMMALDAHIPVDWLASVSSLPMALVLVDSRMPLPPGPPAQSHCFSLGREVWEGLIEHRNIVRFSAGSCRHPGMAVDTLRVDHSVERLLERGLPAFSFLLGDQIYADATAGIADPGNPLERYHDAHARTFTTKAMRKLLANHPVYMTPDDHEWIDNYPHAAPLVKQAWPDWSKGSEFEQRHTRVEKIANNAVDLFQRLQTPHPFGRDYAFEHGPVRVYVMDTRTERKRASRQLIDATRMAAFKHWAAQSPPDQVCMLVTGSVIAPGLIRYADPTEPGELDTWQYAAAQRQEVLSTLVRHCAGRFIVLSGDYHLSGFARLSIDNALVGLAIVAPPLYAPLSYANANAQEVLLQEAIDLDSGARLVATSPGLSPGSGMSDVQISRGKEGHFEVALSQDLMQYELGKRPAISTQVFVLPSNLSGLESANPA